MSGTTPDSMSMVKLPYRQPCVSKRSLISLDDGVAYACPDGIFHIGQGGSQLLTEDSFTRNEWSILIPNTSFSCQYDGKYIVGLPFIDQAYIFGSEGPTTFDLSSSTCMWVDDIEDKLYLAVYVSETDSSEVQEFNAGINKLTYTWKSKAFNLPRKDVMTCGIVSADFSSVLTADEIAAIEAQRTAYIALNATLLLGDIKGQVNSQAINEQVLNGDILNVLPVVPQMTSYILKVYGDGTLIYENVIPNDQPFRLPGDNRYSQYEIEIQGQYKIREIVIAPSIRDLLEYGG